MSVLANPGGVVGIVITILVLLQLLTTAEPVLVDTKFDAWVAPKFVPVIVTWVPTGPEEGFKPVMVGAGV